MSVWGECGENLSFGEKSVLIPVSAVVNVLPFIEVEEREGIFLKSGGD